MELTKDPDGAYSKLISLQETEKEAEVQNVATDPDRPESISYSSNQRFSHLQTISQVGNSGHHSFSVSHALSTTIVPLETSGGEVELPPLGTSQQPPPPKVPLRRLAYLNKPEIPVLFIGTMAAVVNGAILPLFGLMVAKMVNTLYEPADELHEDSKFWALIFVVLGVSSFLIFPTRSYFFSIAGEKLVKRVRLMCFEKIIRMEVSWFDETENSSGALAAKLSTNAATVRGLVGDALGLLVQNIATAIGGLVIAFQANWSLALIILGLLPLLGLNGYLQMKFIQGFSADAKVCSQLFPLNFGV